MKLQDALRKVIRQFGISIIQDKRLMSFLADYKSFDEFPVLRQVMKVIAEGEYGKELCRLAQDESDEDYLRYASELKSSLPGEKNFKEEFACYAVDCISFVLELVSSVIEPVDHGFEPENTGMPATSGIMAVQNVLEDAESLYQNGLAYLNGDGVIQDYNEAEKCFEKAARQGHAEAQYELGKYYCDPDENGSYDLNYRCGTEDEDEAEWKELAEKAVEWFRKAAWQGHSGAQYKLGYIYCWELGVRESISEVAKWIRRAAWQGNAHAQFELGLAYWYGWLDLSPNDVLAVKWILKVAEQCDINAQRQMGEAYRYGRGAVKNCAIAENWYTKAADHCDVDAMKAIDEMYSENYQATPYV